MVLIFAILVICCQIVSGEEYCLARTQKDCLVDTFLVKDEDSCFYSCEQFEDGEDKPGEFSLIKNKATELLANRFSNLNQQHNS